MRSTRTPTSPRSAPAVAVTAAATALAVAVPAQAGAAATRPLVSGQVSVSAVSGALPVAAVISVVQSCPAGSKLDRAATRSTVLEADKELDPSLRWASREYWVAGTVSRYRVVRKTTARTPVALLGAVLCTSSVPTTAKTVTGRASTDLRVWGPAPSDLLLANGTAAVVTDDPEAEQVFATAMRAGGVASSKGSLTNALTAVQEVTQEEGIGAVAAVGETSRRVRRGSFVSMLNSYSYVSDLGKRITTTTG